jgi:hypothetical protein
MQPNQEQQALKKGQLQREKDEEWLDRVTNWTIHFLPWGAGILGGTVVMYLWLGIGPATIASGILSIMCLTLYPALSRRAIKRERERRKKEGW